MPSISIHEEVGYYLSQKFSITSYYSYYLGIIAPDAPNLHGFASKEERWNSHVRKSDYQEWRESLVDFYQKSIDYYDKDFLLGYFVHILTDIVFDDYLYLSIRERIEINYSSDVSHQVMREDMDLFSFKEQEEIYQILSSSSNSFSIQNISSTELLEWKNKQIQTISTESCQYITKNVIDSLNEMVYKEVFNYIQNGILLIS